MTLTTLLIIGAVALSVSALLHATYSFGRHVGRHDAEGRWKEEEAERIHWEAEHVALFRDLEYHKKALNVALYHAEQRADLSDEARRELAGCRVMLESDVA